MPIPDASLFRSPLLMNADDTAVIIVDMQEKLLPVIAESVTLIGSVKRLIEGASILSVPVFYTEQYPKGLGATCDSLTRTADNTFEKTMFSLRQCNALLKRLKDAQVRNLVVAGIESHVCVLQSAFDSIALGFNVAVCVDAVGSRTPQDKTVALRRLDSNGVTLTTVESAIFEWCQTADHPQFKAINRLVR